MGNEESILFIGISIGIIIGALLMALILTIYSPISLSQDTGDDICKQLTNNTASKAIVGGKGSLVCNLPSYDHTQNIIIKTNNDN
jgi:hypothetical protein